VYANRGELSEANRTVDEAWRVSGADAVDLHQPFDVHGVLPAYVARVTQLRAVGDLAQSITLGMRALDIAEQTGYVAWSVYRLLPAIAASAIDLGHRDTLAIVRKRLEHDASWLAHPIGMAWVSVIDGESAMSSGRPQDAVALLERAVAGLEAVPYPFDAACTRVRLARALQGAGNGADAVREARSALQLFESLGARPAAESVRVLLRELGARVPAPHRQQIGLDGLTEREREILSYVARRLSNKEIGAALDISARTVSTHLANIFDKTGMRERAVLGDLARERGMHKR
jgi:DNA-binding NarL/FixJ family response regulator